MTGKGVAEMGEDYMAAARREFAEETGNEVFDVADTVRSLGEFRYDNGKKTLAAYWAAAVREFPKPVSCDSTFINVRGEAVPECDLHEWAPLDGVRLHHTQMEAIAKLRADYLDDLERRVASRGESC